MLTQLENAGQKLAACDDRFSPCAQLHLKDVFDEAAGQLSCLRCENNMLKLMSASVAKAGGAVPACTIGHALHALDFLEHPCLTAQVKSLHLSLTLISTFHRFGNSYEMAELPPELVTRIFEAVRESEPPGYGTIDFPAAYHRFFDNASLVCKTWHELVKPFRTTYTILKDYKHPSNHPEHFRFARNGGQLRKSVPMRNLLVVYSHESPMYDSKTMTSLLGTTVNTVTSLSLETFCVEQVLLILGPAMEQCLARVHRLHIYADAPAYSKILDSIKVPERAVNWNQLAEEIWNSPQRTVPFKELSLTHVWVNGEPSFPDYTLPCPANKVTLRNVYFSDRPTYSKLFPMARDLLVIMQSEEWQWHWGAPHYGLGGVSFVGPQQLMDSQTMAAINLELDSGSTALQTVQVIWVEAPLPHTVEFPLRNNAEITKSPNLAFVSIKATRLDGSVIHHEDIRRPDAAAAFQEDSLLCIESLPA